MSKDRSQLQTNSKSHNQRRACEQIYPLQFCTLSEIRPKTGLNSLKIGSIGADYVAGATADGARRKQEDGRHTIIRCVYEKKVHGKRAVVLDQRTSTRCTSPARNPSWLLPVSSATTDALSSACDAASILLSSPIRPFVRHSDAVSYADRLVHGGYETPEKFERAPMADLITRFELKPGHVVDIRRIFT